jgi:malate dehydrogenase (oxaloacetate-decarboxylating)
MAGMDINMSGDQNIGGKSIIVRLEMNTNLIKFGEVASAISKAGGDIIAIDVIQTSQEMTVRDLTVTLSDIEQINNIVEQLKMLQGAKVINVSDRTFLLHLGGEIRPSHPFKTVMIYRVYIRPM